MSKIIICLVDASLNWYFLYTVRKRLVKYHGLKKYASLVRFNFRLMAISISLDVGLPFLTPHPPPPLPPRRQTPYRPPCHNKPVYLSHERIEAPRLH